MALRVGDSFCGAGGSSLGAQFTGARLVFAINHWEIAAVTYERNHGLRPHRTSIFDVDPLALPPADVLLFSPECQSHGSARGAAPRDEVSRGTAMEVVRFVRTIQPRLFVCENVPGIRSWPLFGKWIAQIEDLGYGVNRDGQDRPGQVLDSADWGVPQNRQRWFLVGGRGYIPHIQSPRRPHRTVGECIDFSLPTSRIDSKRRSAKTLAAIAEGRRLFGDAPFLRVYYGSGPQVMGLDRPCRTVTTRDRFMLVHGDRVRFLQPLELARIMGFPDTYYLHGSRAARIMQLGNAVAPAQMAGILEQAA